MARRRDKGLSCTTRNQGRQDVSDFEFGLLYSFRNPPQWHAPWQQVYDEHIAHIVEMERAGFDTIWLTEHHFSEDGYLPQLATMTGGLGSLRATTETPPLSPQLENGAMQPWASTP